MGQYRRKLKKGTRYYYSGQYLGQQYFSRAIYRNITECKKAERAKINEIDEQSRNPVRDMRLWDLMQDRLDQLKFKSVDYYKEHRRYFKKLYEHFGDVKVSEVQKGELHKLLLKEAKRLRNHKKGNFKVNAMLRSFRALFNYANKIHDLNLKNPCDNIEFFPIDIRLKYIPPDEHIEAVKEISNASQRFLIDFVDETACRIMEAVRFRYEDIDGDLITLWTRKAKNSNLTPRRVPKPACLKEQEKGRVFKDWNAYPRFLEEKVKELDQTKWNWHNLRHCRASIWASNGMNTFELMVRLGHSNLHTTKRYLQLLGFTRF